MLAFVVGKHFFVRKYFKRSFLLWKEITLHKWMRQNADILTPEIKTVAEKENMSTEELMELVAKGVVAIPANKNHKTLSPEGIGQGLRTKINVNLGISRDAADMDLELEKVRTAINMKAEAIMDLSELRKNS